MGDVLLPGGVEVSDAQLEALRTMGQHPQNGQHSDVTLALAAQKAELDAQQALQSVVQDEVVEETEQAETFSPVVEVPGGTTPPAEPVVADPSEAPATEQEPVSESSSAPTSTTVVPSPEPTSTEQSQTDSASTTASSSDAPSASSEASPAEVVEPSEDTLATPVPPAATVAAQEATVAGTPPGIAAAGEVAAEPAPEPEATPEPQA